MAEIGVQIPVEEGGISLEGLFAKGANGRNVVICHPLPLYGGSMDNNVVVAAQRAFSRLGWGTLRYNFRGVGRSGGTPGNGEKDVEDVLAVCRRLEEIDPGRLDIAGYSYGAYTVLGAAGLGLTADSFSLFSPPLDFISFEGLSIPDVPVLITVGNQDEFCAVKSLRNWLETQKQASNVTVEIFPYCDHFYWEFSRELSGKIEDFLQKTYPDSLR